MNFFYYNTSISILNTPLFPSVTQDVPTWKLEKDGVYTVKSAYTTTKLRKYSVP